jgi:hypothetical protein
MKKIVNGQEVDMSPEEEAAILAQWAANPVYVPQVVSMRQARLALLAAGKLGQVQAAIDALPSPQKEVAALEWEYSQEVRRDWPFVAQLAPALGLSDADLDNLFIEAEKL